MKQAKYEEAKNDMEHEKNVKNLRNEDKANSSNNNKITTNFKFFFLKRR